MASSGHETQDTPLCFFPSQTGNGRRVSAPRLPSFADAVKRLSGIMEGEPDLSSREGFGRLILKIFHEPPHLIVVSDHLQGGRAAIEFEDNARVSAGHELKVIPLQPPNAKSTVLVRLSKRVTQECNGLGNLNLSLGLQVSRLGPVTGGELNL